MGKRLLLEVDGNNLMRKMLYGMKPLSYKGQWTQAIKGTLSKLEECRRTFNPSHIAIAFDANEKTFRHKLYEYYKGNREEGRNKEKPDHATEESFISQMEIVLELLPHMGYHIQMGGGYEADDWIGSSATQYEVKYYDEKGKVIVWSGDKDMAALVSRRITHCYPLSWSKNGGPSHLLLDKHGVREKFGVVPSQMVDYLAIIGDTVDNIPGIKGLGPKNAIQLLEKYGNLNDIWKHRRDLTPTQRKHLEAEGKKNIRLWQKLVQMKLDIPVDFKAMKPQEGDMKRAKKILSKLGMTEELKRYT